MSQRGPKVTISSHDDSKVTALIEAGTCDAESHDRSSLQFKSAAVESDKSNPVKRLSGIDWTKWGAILTAIGIVVAIIIALSHI